MLRNVVIHLHNEQPLLGDLATTPAPSDAALVCSNLRTFSGKAPVFAMASDSTFVFPMQQVHFLEIRAASLASHEDGDGKAAAAEPPEPPDRHFAEGADDPTEDLLRRIREA